MFALVTTLGEAIRTARIDLQMSQEKLAVKAGVSTKTIGRYERGEVAPEELTAAKIEGALGWDRGTIASYAPLSVDTPTLAEQMTIKRGKPLTPEQLAVIDALEREWSR